MLRIAIVEDNDTDREIITDALGRFETEENEHFSITEFHDAMDFLEQRKMDFQMVFMDIQMPVMDGYDAAARIRRMKDEKKASIPIIAMTANAFEEDAKKCLAAGMNAHLAKPLDIGKLIATIAQYKAKEK